ncbi:MAG: TraX family protein [Paraclostridium sp.]
MEKLKFNGFQIKIFMALLMVLDHIKYFIPSNLEMIFHVITRVVAVWFAYTAVQGVMYTRNLKKYLIRLFSWGIFMMIGNSILNKIFMTKDVYISNNIFMTLAMGALMLTALTKINNKVLKYVATAVIFVIGTVFTEGGTSMIPFMLITYLTYGNDKARNIWYALLSFALFIVSFRAYDDLAMTLSMLSFNSDFMFIFVLPFIYMYNGEKGTDSKFGKYFFYIFYPAHLWLIATIAYFMK